MTSIERNDLMPTQKLEWVTPKISLMDAMYTDGKQVTGTKEVHPPLCNGNNPNTANGNTCYAPS
jgi:hypothetical protein